MSASAPRAVRIYYESGDDEAMIHWPNGQVEFMTFWNVIKLLWLCTRNQWRVELNNELLG